MAPVFTFGPLHNLLIARSGPKTVQVFGTPLPFQQLNHFLTTPPVFSQRDDGICSSGAVITVNSSSCVKEEEQKQAVVHDEKHTPSDASLSPDVFQSPSNGPERPTLLLPYTPTIFPQTTIPESEKVIQVLNWRNMEDVRMLHQKQTSPQLLQFLKAKAKNLGPGQVRAWSEDPTGMSTSPKPVSTYVGVKAHQPKHVPDDVIDTEVPKEDIISQAHVFQIKRVESSGCLTYAYVTATSTELWDLGDIFTEMVHEDSETSHVQDEACGNPKQEDLRPCLNTEDPTHQTSRVQTLTASGITIPEFHIDKYGETEVVVSHIISPGDFYIQQVDSTKKLQALLTELVFRHVVCFFFFSFLLFLSCSPSTNEHN